MKGYKANMKGYKALDMEMKAANGMPYEMNKLYVTNGVLLPLNGFYFCKSLEALNGCGGIKCSRIFRVEASGKIRKGRGEYAAEKIKLVKELTKEEINDYFEKNQKRLIKSSIWYIRSAVASQGYGLDELICDKNYQVRIAVAEQGYGLEKLINDEDCDVRIAVARQGYGLDRLIYDEDWQVRCAVAEQGYGLDILIHDEDDYVRYTARKELVYNK